MRVYDVISIEKEIERVAQENDGEIPEDLLQQLVEMEMQVPEKINGIVKYIKHLEYFADCCKQEKERVNTLQKKAENRISSIKRYMTPFVLEKGGFDSGTFKLGTRKSVSVNLEADFDVDEYMNVKIERVPDKKKIKDDLKAGKEIPGASLFEKQNLQIK